MLWVSLWLWHQSDNTSQMLNNNQGENEDSLISKKCTSENMKLSDQVPFWELGKLWQIPIKSASNQKYRRYVNNEKDCCMKIKIDLLGQDSNCTGNNPEQSKTIPVIPEEIRSLHEISNLTQELHYFYFVWLFITYTLSVKICLSY